MAMTDPVKLRGLSRLSLTTADAASLSDFYIRAFGFRRLNETRLAGAAFRQLMGIQSDATCVTLGLGEEIVELMEFDIRGAPYPPDAIASDIIFQHFALVTADMTEAWLALSRTRDWRPITQGGPQRLPQSAGGVTAFKLRDPDGHPLELLAFPRDETPPKWRGTNGAGTCLGIDHSAISVGDTAASTAFYAAHGLHRSSHSHNQGPEQSQLDGLPKATVDVTGLSLEKGMPHVELLCYQHVRTEHLRLNSNDVAAARLVFESDDVLMPRRRTDPDGHQLMILPSSQESRTT